MITDQMPSAQRMSEVVKPRCTGGADLTFATLLAARSQANVKSKAPPESIFSSGPLIPTFAKVSAAIECECWNRPTSDGAGNGAIVGAGAASGTRLSVVSTTPPRFLLLLERHYAKAFKKPVAISLECHHTCYRGLTTAASCGVSLQENGWSRPAQIRASSPRSRTTTPSGSPARLRAPSHVFE